MDTTERDIRSLFANTGELDRDEIACLLLQLVERIQNLESSQPKRSVLETHKWVGLTDEEIDQGLLRSDYALQTAHAWRAGVVFAMTQLKEKNT